MKQTKNALSMLLNAYRSVFKSAYFKGMASAVILTAGLAAGTSANAEGNISGGNFSAVSGDVTVDGVGSGDSNYKLIQIWNSSGAVTNTNEFNLTITSGEAAYINASGNFIYASGGFTAASGNIVIDIASSVTDASSSGLTIGSNSFTTNASLNSLAVNRGVLRVASGSTVSVNTLSVGNSSTAVDLDNIEAAIELASGATAGTLDTTSAVSGYDTSTIINVNNGGKILVTAGDNGSATLQGADLNINGGAIQFSGNGATLEVKVATGEMTSGTIDISSGNTVKFDFQELKTATTGEEDGEVVDAVFSVTGGTLDVAGTLELSGSGTEEAVFDLSYDDVTLQASSTGNSAASGSTIKVDSGVALKISENNLKEYTDAEATQVSGADGTTYYTSGAVTLSGGTLWIADDEVDLSDDLYSVSGSGVEVSNANILVAGTGSTIKAQTVDMSGAFNGGSGAAGLAFVFENLNLKADSSAFDSMMSDYFSGASGFTISQSLSVNTDFTADIAMTYDTGADYAGENDIVGTIAEGYSYTFGSGTETIVNGQWELDTGSSNTVTMQGGDSDSGAKLYVGSGAYASLTITSHDMVMESGAAIEIKGAADADVDGDGEEEDHAAYLDLTGVNTLTASGGESSISVQEYGMLKLTSSQLEQIAEYTGTTGIVLSASGSSASGEAIIAVDGDVDLAFTDVSGSAGVGVIGLSGNGVLDVDGDVTLTNPTTAAESGSISFAGTIKADKITISDAYTHSDESSEDTALVSSGSFVASDGFASVNDKVIFSGGDSTLTLAADSIDGTGSVTTGLEFKDGAQFTVTSGVWTSTEELILTSGTATFGNEDWAEGNDEAQAVEAVFSAAKLEMTSGSVTINKTADVTFDAIDATSGSISVSGALTINGAATTTTDETTGTTTTDYGVNYADGVITVNGGGSLTFGETALEGMFSYSGDTISGVNEGYGSITTNSGSKVYFAYAADTDMSFTTDELVTVKTTLLGGTGENGEIAGVLYIGSAAITGVTDQIDAETNTIDYDVLAPVMDVVSDVGQDDLMSVGVVNIDGGATIMGQYGYLNGEDGADGVEIKGESSLNNAADNDGHFATAVNGTSTVDLDITVQDYSSLTVANGGTLGEVTLTANNEGEEARSGLIVENTDDSETIIGSISKTEGTDGTYFSTNGGTTTVNGDVTVDDFEVNGTTNVSGDITAHEIDVRAGQSLTSLGEDADQSDITTQYLIVETGGSVDTNILTISGSSSEGEDDASAVYAVESLDALNDAVSYKDAYIAGTVQANEINVYTEDFVIGGGSVTADKMTVTSGAVSVGHESFEDNLSTDDADDDAIAGQSGYLTVDELNLEGDSVLLVGTDYTNAAAVAAVNSFGAVDDDLADISSGTIDGRVVVGSNGVLGLGYTSVDDVLSDISDLLDGGALDGDDIGSVLLVNKAVTIENGAYVLLSADSAYDTLYAYSRKNETNQYDLELGANSAAVLTENAFAGEGAAINFDFSDATVGVDEEGGEVVLIGTDYKAGQTLNVMDDADNDGVNIVGGTLTVRTINGLLQTVLEEGEDVATNAVVLGFNEEEGRAILSGASDPVYEYLRSYVYGVDNPDAEEADQRVLTTGTRLSAEDYAALDEDEQAEWLYDSEAGNYYQTASNAFLDTVVTTGNGRDAETVSRLAAYAGTAEVALAASSTTSEAINNRMGIGNPKGGLIMADNHYGAGIWLAPVYKNHESDDFDAEGVDYGVDIDLYGVALGADYTFAQGFRVGAMFNIGSGDADGDGAGSAVDNDFDYWALALYGGFAYENFSIVGDISYTEVDNDIDAHTAAAGTLSTSLDASVLSVGLTGQYKFEFDALDVTPHLGLRYSYIDIDDYSLGGIVKSDVDDLSVFSIPVGVALSKDISTASGWVVKPALDLTVTFNTGDDEMDSDVTFYGVDLTKDLSTEFIDSVTYGATIGLQVQKDAFQFGLGVNYTGSENTDEYGVAANARFTF